MHNGSEWGLSYGLVEHFTFRWVAVMKDISLCLFSQPRGEGISPSGPKAVIISSEWLLRQEGVLKGLSVSDPQWLHHYICSLLKKTDESDKITKIFHLVCPLFSSHTCMHIQHFTWTSGLQVFVHIDLGGKNLHTDITVSIVTICPMSLCIHNQQHPPVRPITVVLQSYGVRSTLGIVYRP